MSLTVYPSYYPDFACIASRCRHSCCVGWEIDIDEDSFCRYQAETGAIGKRLRACIDVDGAPHFRLYEGERCPFLNREGLCDLILSLGEDALCEICREHPRFYTVLSDRTEVGLGLCCEEAARLILTAEDTGLTVEESADEALDGWDAEKLAYREDVFALLADRTLSVSDRAARLAAMAKTAILPTEAAIGLLSSLEILTDEWRSLLTRWQPSDGAAFSRYMAEREEEYARLMRYLAYRYLADAYDGEDLRQKTAFLPWTFSLVFSLGSFVYAQKGVFTLEDQIGLLRLFSSEIEYNEDNLYAILDTL